MLLYNKNTNELCLEEVRLLGLQGALTRIFLVTDFKESFLSKKIKQTNKQKQSINEVRVIVDYPKKLHSNISSSGTSKDVFKKLKKITGCQCGRSHRFIPIKTD